MNFLATASAAPLPAPVAGSSKSQGGRTPKFFAQAVNKATVMKADGGFWAWLESKIAHNLLYEGPESVKTRIDSGKNPTGADKADSQKQQ
eukprot:tig00000241_g20885.t1